MCIYMCLFLMLCHSFPRNRERPKYSSQGEDSVERSEGDRLTLQVPTQRRESFLYKSDSEFELASKCVTSRHHSFSEGWACFLVIIKWLSSWWWAASSNTLFLLCTCKSFSPYLKGCFIVNFEVFYFNPVILVLLLETWPKLDGNKNSFFAEHEWKS